MVVARDGGEWQWQRKVVEVGQDGAREGRLEVRDKLGSY